ncbi:MAG: hypothetical protein PF489_05440 [Salinivirgaceae bacterium]|jgi:protein subunit release factor A|nr:hypothetical protein [Salinivirgaceae bacterium]
MNATVKKIADQNFKANSNLKKQYIFDSGYCFFNEARAKEHARESKSKYATITRDAKAEKKEADQGKRLEQLKADHEAKLELLLDETDESKKTALEAEIEKLEAEISEIGK